MAFKDLVNRVKQSHPYRAWKRYGDANGDLLAAGVGYFAFFSIFPALALAFAVFGFVLRGRPDLLDTIAESLNTKCKGQSWVFVTSQEDMDKVIGDRSRQQGNEGHHSHVVFRPEALRSFPRNRPHLHHSDWDCGPRDKRNECCRTVGEFGVGCHLQLLDRPANM